MLDSGILFVLLSIVTYCSLAAEHRQEAEISIPPNQRVRATLFPFAIQHGIKLQYDDSNDGLFDLPTLTVRVYGGRLVPSNPFPGLYVNNRNTTCIEATGPIQDLQLWIESGRNTSDYSNESHEYVVPGGGIRYIPPIYDWVGRAEVHFTLNGPSKYDKDGEPPFLAFAKMTIEVDPYLEMKINIISHKGGMTTTEDKSFHLFQKSNGNSVSFGGVSRKSVISCFLQSSEGSFDQSELIGTPAILNRTLTGIKYVPKANFNGEVNASLSCENIHDYQNDQVSFVISVLPVNDRPTIKFNPSGVFEANEDEPVLLGPSANLYIVDVDAHETEKSMLAVDLSVSQGLAVLRLPPPELLGRLYVTTNSSSHLRLLGRIEEVNIALQYITLAFHQDWYGRVRLIVQCTDVVELGAHSFTVQYYEWLSEYIDFVVKSVNDFPIIAIHAPSFANLVEGDKIDFKDGAVSIEDVDSFGSDHLNLTIEIHAVKGIVPAEILIDESVVSREIDVLNTQFTKENERIILFSMEGNLSILSRNLESMSLILLEEWFGICYECISLHVTDAYGGAAQEKITFKVQPIDDAPIMRLSTGKLMSNEDQEFLFSDVVNFTILDADILYSNKDSMFDVTIQSSMNGSIGLKNFVPGCYIRNGRPYTEPESNLSFKGGIEVIYRAMQLLYYIPPANVDSSDVVSFKILDSSHLSDEVNLQISFSSINDPPTVQSHEVQKIMEDENGLPKLRTAFTVVDNDGADEGILLTLSLQPGGIGDIYCPRLVNSHVEIKVNQTDKIVLFGAARSINFIAGEIIINLYGDNSDRVARLTAEVEDEEGETDSTDIEVNTQMNQKVPFLTTSTRTTSILEDNPLYLGQLAKMEGNFDESAIFELKFTCLKNLTSDKVTTFSARFRFVDLSLQGIHVPVYDKERGTRGNIVLQGNMNALNYAVQKLVVKPPPNFFGNFILNIGLRAWNDSLFDDKYIFKEVVVEVISVDDAPVIRWDGSSFIDKYPVLEIDEDSFRNFGKRLTIADFDDSNGIISVQISTSFGAICSHLEGIIVLDKVAFTFFDTEEAREYQCVDENKIAINANINEINNILRTLAYKPNLNWWGMDKLELKVHSNEIHVVQSIRIAVRPQPDNTVVLIPEGILSVNEDSKLSVHDIFIIDIDIDPPEIPENNICDRLPQYCHITVVIDTFHGTLGANIHGSNFVFYREEDRKLLMRGSREDINHSLETLFYEPDHNYFGEDRLNVTVTKVGGSISESLSINITGVNDAPKLLLPITTKDSVFLLWEDSEGVIGDESCVDSEKSSSFITCQRIKIDDSDDSPETNATMKLTLSSENGLFKFPRLPFVTDIIKIQAPLSPQGFTSNVVLEGPMESLNWVITGIIFKGNRNFNTVENFEELAIKVEDQHGEVAMDSLFLRIIPVNDEPVISVPGEIVNYNKSTDDGIGYKRIKCNMLTMDEDSSIHITGISVRDIDYSLTSEMIEMTVSATNGTILFGDHVNMAHWVEGFAGEYLKRIQIKGTIDNMNDALKYISYQPDQDFNGEDIIRIDISDMGNVGFMRMVQPFQHIVLNDTAEIPVKILPVEDFPVVIAPSYLVVDEDTASFINIDISHPDSNLTIVQLSVHCDHGKIKFTYMEGLSFVNGTSNYNGYISVLGTVLAFQTSLKQLVFTPDENWNNAGSKQDNIIITVQNFSQGRIDMKTTTHVMKVDVLEVNDPPFWNVPGSTFSLQPYGGYVIDSISTIELYEDSSIQISPISISDVDAIESEPKFTFKITIKVENGTVELSEYNGVVAKHDGSLIEFTSTFKSVNRALERLVYTPLPNFYGTDSITLQAIDREYNKIIHIPVCVHAVSDPPIMKAPTILSCSEEEWCEIPGVFIDDVDMYSEICLEISVTKGIVAFAGGLTKHLRSVKVLEGIPSGDSNFRLLGTATDLNMLLQRLGYLPVLGSAKSFAVIDFITVVPDTVVETGKILKTAATSHVIIENSKNNHPFIRYDKALYHDDPDCGSSFRSTTSHEGARVHAFCNNSSTLPPFECFEDIDCSLYGLSIHDPDSPKLQLTLTVEKGQLSIDQSPGTRIMDRQTSLYLDVRGDPIHINRALESLKYRSSVNFVGKDVIILKISDQSLYGNSTFSVYEMSIDIIVHNVEDHIEIAGPSYRLHIQNEDALSILPTVRITHEHSVPSKQFVYVEADVDVVGGSIYFSESRGINFTSTGIGSENKWMKSHNSHAFYHDNAFFDGSSTSSAAQSWDGMKSQWWRKVSICGLLENINRALDQVTFVSNEHSNSDVNGLSEMNIGVRRVDMCQSVVSPPIVGFEQEYDDILSIVIQVKSVNDAPILIAGRNTGDGFINVEALTIDEDSQVHVPTYVHDVDDDIVRVEISTCTSGQISVTNETPGQNNDLYFLEGSTGVYYHNITMKGTMKSLNGHLVNLKFKGEEHYNGSDCAVDVIVCDDHGGCNSRQIQIISTPIEDPLILYMPVGSNLSRPLITIDEGSEVLIGSDWVNVHGLMMKKVESHIPRFHGGDDDGVDNENNLHLRPLEIGRAFLLSNENNNGTERDTIVCVDISVVKGELSLKNPLYQNDATDGLVFFNYGDDGNYNGHTVNRSIKIRGSIEAMNEKVTGNLFYHSIEGEMGHTNVSVTVSREIICKDGTNRPIHQELLLQEGCECNFEIYDVQGSLPVLITPTNSPPRIEWWDANGGHDMTIKTKMNERVPIRGFKVIDDDIHETYTTDSQQRILQGFVTLTISVTRGSLSFKEMIGLTTIVGDGLDDDIIQFMGTLDNINKALTTLEYQCVKHDGDTFSKALLDVQVDHEEQCQSGITAQVTITVDDNSFTGRGGATKDEIHIDILIL